MSIRVVFEYPMPARMRRFWSGLLVWVGFVLVLVGVLASVLPIIYLMAVLATLPPGGERVPEPNAALIVAFMVMVAGLTAGLRLIRGKRRLVLFLRRFGFTEATKALTFAVATALGNSWRLITLDDDAVAPVGPRKGMSWLAIGLGLAGAAMAFWGLTWLFGGGLKRQIDETFRHYFGEPTLREFLPRVVAALVVTFISGLVTAAIVFVPTALAGALAAFGWTSYGAVRRAERSRTLAIDSPGAVGPATESVARRSRRFLGPRLVVARVASSIWQEVVRRLAAVSSVVTIDISQPTENLLWEIEMIRARRTPHWILVGQLDHLNRISAGDTSKLTDLQKRLLQLIDGEEVLAYSGRAGLRRFSRALGARLQALARLNPP